MTTLFDATLETARVLMAVISSTAGTGTTTTLVDDVLKQDYPDDYFNNGTIWFTSGALLGKTAVPTDFVRSTGTLTIPTQTNATTGLTYSLAPRKFPLSALVEAVNGALAELGKFAHVDTSLSASDVESISLGTITDVTEVQYKSGDSYLTYANWSEIDGTLYFKSKVNGDLRIIYKKEHEKLSGMTDTLEEGIYLRRLAWEAAAHAWRWKMQQIGKDDAQMMDMIKEAQQRAGLHQGHALWKPQPAPRYGRW